MNKRIRKKRKLKLTPMLEVKIISPGTSIAVPTANTKIKKTYPGKPLRQKGRGFNPDHVFTKKYLKVVKA